MRRLIYLLLLLAFIASCTRDEKIPKNVLQPERMKEVIWDVFLAEAWARQAANADSTVIISDKTKQLTAEALATHQMSEKDFFRSYNWYVNHPAIFQPMLDSLYEQMAEIENPTLPAEVGEEEPAPRLKEIKRSRHKIDELKKLRRDREEEDQ